MSDSPEQWFHRRATHFVEAQILFHLGQAEVFHLLDARGALSAAEIAQELGLASDVLDCLLDYIVHVDALLEVDEGRYGLTQFGAAVLRRFGREDADRKHFNLFDVRVGAYGPVWSGLGRLLRGEPYGEGLERQGDLAAAAVYTVSSRIIDPLHDRLQQLGSKTVVEIGTSTGLLLMLRAREPSWKAWGVDRSHSTLDAARRRAGELGVDGIEWIQADFFQPSTWAPGANQGERPRVIFSVHFHELMAAGRDRMQAAIRVLGDLMPGAFIVALEQPRLPLEARDRVSESTWLYSQSNVLIHHLIGNGRILGHQQWIEIFVGAGCVLESSDPLGFLGYEISVFRLPGGA